MLVLKRKRQNKLHSDKWFKRFVTKEEVEYILRILMRMIIDCMSMEITTPISSIKNKRYVIPTCLKDLYKMRSFFLSDLVRITTYTTK